MTAITDKIGRASIPTGYAQATTVKTARLVGATVLEAYDLSKFPLDTPVYFLTYKKTTDPVTNITSVTNQRSWKALVNPDNNTLTNLTIAPGYNDDIGNAQGDFIELMPTSFWENSLVDALQSSLNADGSMKTSAVNTALGITANAAGWTPLAVVPSVLGSDGQRQHRLKYTAVDYTQTLNAGMRVKAPRVSTVATQSAQFVSASSQYASKTSPTGITFTDNFTCEAWINPATYTGSEMDILGRLSTTGFVFGLTSAGQPLLYAASSGSVNKLANAYQSVPLNKQTHLAATFSGGTVVIYIDGVAVPTTSSGTGTNLVQAGNFTIGYNGTSNYFNGLVAHARVWSTVRTAQQIRDNANISLTGSETGLVGAWSLNGNFNDKTVNGNNLTATNGAIATYAANPQNATEYAIITDVSLVGSDTVVTVFCPAGTGIPNETLGTTSYAIARSPFGFPADEDSWSAIAFLNLDCFGSAVTGVWWNPGSLRVSVPTGKWEIEYSVNSRATGSPTTFVNQQVELSLSPSTSGIPISHTRSGSDFSDGGAYNPPARTTEAVHTRAVPITATAQTLWYVVQQANASNLQLNVTGFRLGSYVKIKSTYL